MQWTKSKKRYLDKRNREGFLIFPKTIGCKTKWLERAKWVEIVRTDWTAFGGAYYFWDGLEWIEETKQKR